MSDFLTIYKEFEETKDLCSFTDKYKDDDVSIRFLLIRSLDNANLKEILKLNKISVSSNRIKDLMEQVYNTSITVQALVDYIESNRNIIIQQREEELKGLTDVLDKFPDVSCGVRNDKVDDIIKQIVRNKSLKTYDDFEKEINNSVLPRVSQYIHWSYYNQTSNDIIELYFLKHPKILPTLRKIPNIDFFLKIDDDIIPFDLKFTHISDDYFNLHSQGLVPQGAYTANFDDFACSVGDSELIKIKNFYSSIKRSKKLPNYGDLSKVELIDILDNNGSAETVAFINEITDSRTQYVTEITNDLHPLEWWNYKYQGERKFCNNNRIFIFLAYKNRFIDGRPLKGNTEKIGEQIINLLNSITKNDLHKISYKYEKDESLKGNYSALAFSTIYIE